MHLPGRRPAGGAPPGAGSRSGCTPPGTTSAAAGLEGATWSGDGDLFVYLDTGPGGTTASSTRPGRRGGAVQLSNEAMQADTLVWVQDAHTAALLHWDGSAWGRRPR